MLKSKTATIREENQKILWWSGECICRHQEELRLQLLIQVTKHEMRRQTQTSINHISVKIINDLG